MDPATEAFLEGNLVVFQNVPQDVIFEFGIDAESWVVGPRFAGLKMIPPGPHYIHWRMRKRVKEEYSLYDATASPRFGHFCHFTKRNMLVLCWDPHEELAKVVTGLDELQAVRSCLPSLEPHLGPYPMESKEDWSGLSKWIRSSTLERILGDVAGDSTNISLRTYPFSSMSTSYHGASELSRLNPNNPGESSLEINFTPISRNPKEAAKLHGILCTCDDTSIELERHLQNRGPKELLAELQLAFIFLVAGENFEGFEQWKGMVRVICHGFESISKHQSFFAVFLDTLQAQLRHATKSDICDDGDSIGGFLFGVLQDGNLLLVWLSQLIAEIFDALKESPHVALERSANDFRQFAHEFLKWDLDSCIDLSD